MGRIRPSARGRGRVQFALTVAAHWRGWQRCCADGPISHTTGCSELQVCLGPCPTHSVNTAVTLFFNVAMVGSRTMMTHGASVRYRSCHWLRPSDEGRRACASRVIARGSRWLALLFALVLLAAACDDSGSLDAGDGKASRGV